MQRRAFLPLLLAMLCLGTASAHGQACNINPFEVKIENEGSTLVEVSWSGGPQNPTLLFGECFKIDANEGDDINPVTAYQVDGTDNVTYEVTIRVGSQVTRFEYIECTDPAYTSHSIAPPPAVCTQTVYPGRSLIDGAKNDLYVAIDDEGMVHMGWEASNEQTIFTDFYRANGYFNILDSMWHPIGASAWLSFYLNILELEAPYIEPPEPVTYDVHVDNNLDESVRIDGVWEAMPYQESYSPDHGTLTLDPSNYVTANGSDWEFGYWTQWRPDLGYWGVPNPAYTTEQSNGTLLIQLDQVPSGTTTLEFDGEYQVIKGGGPAP